MNGAGIFFLVLFILLIVSAIGWVGFTQFRARRLGLPPPSWKSYIPFLSVQEPSPYGPPQPRRGGIVGWIEDRVAGMRQKRDRTAVGAYEQGRALDPDDAWDSRVPGDQGYGHAGYYNETELEEGRGRSGGLGNGRSHLAPSNPYSGAGGDASYSGSGYQMNIATPHDEDDDEPPRGRSRSRGGDYNPFGDGAMRNNPFEDTSEELRRISPRPVVDTEQPAASQSSKGKTELDSPGDRRSIFRENM